ncbi:MBL fold metallo-hydrolase [Kitasatospora sp. CMC57]|uniref:MBL fold metallo-hydrolase n=1 Tax=Kitasatospora sp. CMC57 TaxID=3231513 RepID=UPI0038B5585B
MLLTVPPGLDHVYGVLAWFTRIGDQFGRRPPGAGVGRRYGLACGPVRRSGRPVPALYGSSEEGQVLDFAGGAVVVAVPGHTDGSIALHLPEMKVLVTGDAVANVGRTMLGVFNTDRARAVESLHRLAELDVDTALFGHGEPIVHGAAIALRRAAAAAV